ncbi:MAG TPA: NAD-dependent epimerase/dehydratase family protein [Sphingobacterium sp.]|nr:NAD-dependent epimerase/dehydratase family protein [Sphingobacterium sp.]
MQVILGAGGDISTLLAKELNSYTSQIKLVARHPKPVNPGDECFPADLLDAKQVDRAVSGAEVAYLTVGLKYDSRIWERQWPLIMQNVIDACRKHGCRLVFFDNVYLYNPEAVSNMTEESATNPISRKGRVRLQVLELLQQAMEQQGLQALVARSADFYGPDSKNGILNTLVLNSVSQRKKPSWLADAHKIHSFTYTPDAAKATALLGNTDSAYQQVWHLPTSGERLTGKAFVELAASIAGTKASYTVLTPFLLSLGGLFNRTIKEVIEMNYQYDRDYFFDSSKFCDAFGFVPTSYETGIREVLGR